MSVVSIYRWHDGQLDPLDFFDMTDATIMVADSWLVTAGAVLALDLHRSRFLEVANRIDPEARYFWDAAMALIPREGDWFPRVEMHLRDGIPLFILRLREAPDRTKSLRLASHHGSDPRTKPMVKGPDTDALLMARTAAEQRGADEAVILSPEGYVVEGAYSALLWWRGQILCAPSLDLARVDSVTARSVIALATALGTEIYYESVTPPELDGVELWALSALHGIRIVTGWVDGPETAELPGRLSAWRARMDRLRRPLPEAPPSGLEP